MAEIVIDGKKCTFEGNKTIIEVAFENGIDLPHFCWHPELSVAGNCRMCLIEMGNQKKNPDGTLAVDENGNPVIAYMPKLQIACGSKATPGLYVRTNTPQVIKAREAVMEFLLINHPLDCPICDEAGQCKLQNYTFKYSTGECRFTENKNPKPKRVSWSDKIMYDAQRCISCSRCIRFAKEFADQPVLSFINRGDRVYVKMATDCKFDSPYSMNIIDSCPVGALTSKDFRFKSRVWDMAFNDSVCAGCSRGCNIKIGTRNNKILRIEPRNNMNINRYWMCDEGRLNYSLQNENRLADSKCKNVQVEKFDDAVAKAVQLLKNYKAKDVLFIASPKATIESNYMLAKLAQKSIKTQNIVYIDYTDKNFGDEKLRTNDRAANTNGMKIVLPNIKPLDFDDLKIKVQKKEIKLLYILDSTLSNDSPINEIAENAECVIAHCENESRLSKIADVAFASASCYEEEGTLVNEAKRIQHLTPAIANRENIRTMGMKLGRFEQFGTEDDKWGRSNLSDNRSDWRILANIASGLGSDGKKYLNAEDVFTEIGGINPQLSNISYQILDEYQGLTLGNRIENEKKYRIYKSNNVN